MTRFGKVCHEYPIQRCFLTGLCDTSVGLFQKPLILERKRAFDHFVAKRQLSNHPREYGHTGLVVSFQKYDRAIRSAMRKLSRKHQAAVDEKNRETMEAGHWYLLWLKAWGEIEACFAHDLAGGLRHAILQSMQDKELLKRSFLVVESCRNGYNLLMEWLGP